MMTLILKKMVSVELSSAHSFKTNDEILIDV